jgi:hypothetical protein
MVANRATKRASGSDFVPHPRTLFVLFSTRDREFAERLMLVVAAILWAQLAAGGARNEARRPWMPTGPGARRMPGLRRARRSVSGRRARG